MWLGDIEVRFLDGGAFGLDGGAMFGIVPKALWEKKSPPDEKNRIRMRANSLLVRSRVAPAAIRPDSAWMRSGLSIV